MDLFQLHSIAYALILGQFAREDQPETGLPVQEGETGEVVFTTLTRCGMPLIRCRTGDLSRHTPEICPCWTLFKTMAQVKGRIKGGIELEPGKVVRRMKERLKGFIKLWTTLLSSSLP
jgi:hypothetical protein